MFVQPIEGPTMMPSRRLILALAIGAAGTLAAPAFAEPAGNTPQPFTQQAFETAQKAGRAILVDTYATWCDVCARQAPIIEKLINEPQYKDLAVFRVNFDTQKDIMRKFNARVQSTLIVFRGEKEVGRSVGETQPEWIDDLLQKTLGKSTS